MAEPPTNNWKGCEEFQRPILWKTAPQQEEPIVFIAEEAGAILEIRINEFPLEPLYSLLKNGTVLLHFNDWPCIWGEVRSFRGDYLPNRNFATVTNSSRMRTSSCMVPRRK